MGTRQLDARLEEIYANGGKTYSISRLNTINQCQYQAYLNYVKGIKGKNNIWAICGGKIHDVIEGCIKGTNQPADLKGAIESELADAAVFGVDFPHDKNGGTAIRDNWIANMTKFAEIFTTPIGEFETEQLITFKVRDGVYMIGYIDAIRYNPDGSIWIIDWKTSSQFTKDHLLEAGRQLIVYAMAKELEGFTVKKVSWCMLKYCITKWDSGGKQRQKISEWRNFVKDLAVPVRKALRDAGYDDMEIDFMYETALKENSLLSLPYNVRSQFRTSVYVRDYEITPELREECVDYINRSIDLYETLGDDEDNWQPCNIDKDSFFCAALCGFSDTCKHYNDWKELRNSQVANDEDIF